MEAGLTPLTSALQLAYNLQHLPRLEQTRKGGL